jgi:hypothetical protein
MHDLTIIFTPGDVLAYAKSGTIAGRNFLSDHVRGRKIFGSHLVDTEDLLPLLEKGMRAGLSIFWKK